MIPIREHHEIQRTARRKKDLNRRTEVRRLYKRLEAMKHTLYLEWEREYRRQMSHQKKLNELNEEIWQLKGENVKLRNRKWKLWRWRIYFF